MFSIYHFKSWSLIMEMKPFNELLKKCIEQSEYTVYSISNASNINRTTLQRTLSGERTLNYENLQKLLPFLQLSPQQSKELKSSFISTQLGETRYCKDLLIWQLLNNTPDSNLYSPLYFTDCETASLPINFNYTQLITGSYNIISLICRIIAVNIKYDKKPFLYSLSHFQNDFFRDLYHQLEASCFKSLIIKHVIPFVKQTELSTHPLFNLQVLPALLPFVFEGQTSCQFLYYYEENDFIHACGSLFPYYIVTNRYVILLSCDCQKALFLPETVVSQYKSHIKGILFHANPLLQITETNPKGIPQDKICICLKENAVSFLYQSHKNVQKVCTFTELGLIHSVLDFKEDIPLLDFAFGEKNLNDQYFIDLP